MEMQSVFVSLPYGFLLPCDGQKACRTHVSKHKNSADKTKKFFGKKYILRYILQRNITDFSPNLTP